MLLRQSKGPQLCCLVIFGLASLLILSCIGGSAM